MASLLKIDVSPRGGYSVSRAVGDKYVADWTAKNPSGTVVTRDVSANPLPFVDLPWIIGAYTAPETHSPESKAALKISDAVIDEAFAADEILITTPMYNFGTPSALKAWIDHLVRVGRTFSMSYEGLLKNKKATVIVASGSSYGPGSPMASMDMLTPYLKVVLGFVGITDVTFLAAGNTNDVNQGKETLEEYVAKVQVSA